MMTQLPLAPKYTAPNETAVPDHPVFESEVVLNQVIKECLCGQPKDRVKHDEVFGGFVENCIYDKSLGPGAEQAAEANMKAYVHAWLQPQLNYTAPLETATILTKTVTKKPHEIPVDSGVTYELFYNKPSTTGVKAHYLTARKTRRSFMEVSDSGYDLTSTDTSDRSRQQCQCRLCKIWQCRLLPRN
uniref:Uncharacterized protein n=1 Tax=Spongospora subterranea TaxID=70186 RepID=A0A0H5QQJ9_9EUKA|eukprot:CRZ04303.1 hypothetical protein [Spongospora subterranea]